MKNKRGQQTTSMPFGMIFSIILIAVFFIAAITGIKFFLGLQETITTNQFYENFQEKVDAAWSNPTSTNFEISLPSKIKQVCFIDLEKDFNNRDIDTRDAEYFNEDINLFIYPAEVDPSEKSIKYLDIKNITKTKNPYCIDANSNIVIKRDYGQKLVQVE